MPSYKKYIEMIDKKSIRDCEITSDDVKRYLHIYGPEVSRIKGSTTRQQPNQLTEYRSVQIPNQ